MLLGSCLLLLLTCLVLAVHMARVVEAVESMDFSQQQQQQQLGLRVRGLQLLVLMGQQGRMVWCRQQPLVLLLLLQLRGS
jgi:hypothetical protein